MESECSRKPHPIRPHDYYSRTYPRYQEYTHIEKEHDLIEMINMIVSNRLRTFRDHLYVDEKGNLQQDFKENVLSVLNENPDLYGLS